MTPWHYRADGTPISAPAENPAYCYDWAFGSESESIVLCVWYDVLAIDAGHIVASENMRQLSSDLERLSSDRTRDGKERDRARQQANRARNFDSLVKIAFDRLLPLRLIVNEGSRASRQSLGVSSSTVAKRELDSEPWFVHTYAASGAFRLVRGVRLPGDLADRSSAIQSTKGPNDATQLGAIRIRRGQKEFRENLLSAWGRRCVVTESRIVELLEAAHIVPHADDLDYRTSNGLLLRADIHTLYDLKLLSIDQHMHVHLCKVLLQSEYCQYHGKKIERRPDRGADAPFPDALKRRHQEFVEAERTRSS